MKNNKKMNLKLMKDKINIHSVYYHRKERKLKRIIIIKSNKLKYLNKNFYLLK